MLLEDNRSLGCCLYNEMFYQKPRHNFLCIRSVNIYRDDILIGGAGMEVRKRSRQDRNSGLE